MSIPEAFENAYNIKLKEFSNIVNEVPSEIKVGDELRFKILFYF